MAKRHIVYRCFVPECENFNATPNKHFFSVPKKPAVRETWCKLAKRDYSLISDTSNLRICEDHFNMEQDTVNYMEYKMMKEVGCNVRLTLKQDAVPHIFSWQDSKEPENEAVMKRKRMEIIQQIEEDERKKRKMEEDEEEKRKAELEETVTLYPEPEIITETIEILLTETKSTQANLITKPKYRSKATTVKPNHVSVALSPLKVKPFCLSACTSPIQINKLFNETNIAQSPSTQSSVSFPSKQGSSSDFVPSSLESSWRDSDKDADDDSQLKSMMRSAFIKTIEKLPKAFLGMPQKSFYLIQMLSEKIKAPTINIMITLKKIKLNDSFLILGQHFGYSESMISLIFKKTLPLIAHSIKSLLYMPSKSQVIANLPIAFRARFSNVFSIIDCFEVEVEKPTNAMHQALTWSQYKGCNTLKYLISITPDGLITFISEGYGGRASDVEIVEKCGYLDKLPPNVDVMADRGFKSISHLLHKKKCMLIRPPSVSKSTPSSKDEVKLSKRIAALRIHVERAISRLREFHILLPHSRIDNHLAPMLDNIIITACGIINMQDFLLKV